MSGIYIHIPFCKQACHYCDFHFSTSLKKKPELIAALCQELQLRKNENQGEVSTIYLGGGTPSLLSGEDLKRIFDVIYTDYPVNENAEVTLEANPDDLPESKLKILANSPINRLSIGIQSFFDEDLKLMNRAHNSEEAREAILSGKQYFDNISVDLIYGIPGMSNDRWIENLETAIDMDIPHISSYALTVEPKTALKSLIDKGRIKPVDEGIAKEQYEILISILTAAGYENYEFSNFGKEGYYSRNNTAYWMGKPYLGIGPSAHSFDGRRRMWNVSNNSRYINSLNLGVLPSETEVLTTQDRYNEYIMTRLRTKWGVSLQEVALEFGIKYKEYLLTESKQLLKRELLEVQEDVLKVTRKGKFLSDGIAAELFMVGKE